MILGARGARNLDRGEEKIRDVAFEAALRRRARRVHLEAVLLAAALTALVFVPWRSG